MNRGAEAERGPQKGSRAGQGRTGRKVEPKVGIFWLVDKKLLIDSTPVADAESYGDFKIHPRNHFTVWGVLQRAGTVLPEVEYEELPRGRVMFNTKTCQFTLLADKCILKKKALVSKIRSQMHLPGKQTVTATDSHYRCFRCLARMHSETES